MSTTELASSAPESAIEPIDEHGSAVRFESQCVVIPDHARRSMRPRVVTRSYALPLWKRRTSSGGPSSAPPEDTSAEENQSHLVLRVPLPSFSRKSRSMVRSSDDTPLPPCLTHRSQPSTSPLPSASLARHARTPRKHSPSPSRSDIVTIPLRPCCAACQSVTEAALADGDAWPEHFSRAASRRRSLSADGDRRTITVAGSTASASYGNLGVSISVDEMDKRRRCSDIGPFTTEAPWSSHAKIKKDCGVPFILHRTVASNLSMVDARSPSPTRVTPATPRIPEEDDDENENELFPLPSPKRTPSTSPTPSPAGSLSSLAVAHANQSATSPTPSTCSGDSVGPHPGKQSLLVPPTCSSSSSLSLPKLTESTTDLTPAEDPPPSPGLLSALPSLSGRHRSLSPSPRISCMPPTPTDALIAALDSNPSRSHDPTPALTHNSIPSSPSPPQPSVPPHSPTHIRFPWQFRRSVSVETASLAPSSPTPSFSPSTSPKLSTSPNTKRSFSISSSRHFIADAIRGVGAMGSIGMGPGI